MYHKQRDFGAILQSFCAQEDTHKARRTHTDSRGIRVFTVLTGFMYLC